MHNMREIIALITAIAAPPIAPIAPIAIIVFLILAVIILIGIIILFRSQRKKKGANAADSSTAPGWQPQGQQQRMPGSWHQVGTGNAGDNTWGQHRQAGSWRSQQQPGPW